MAERSSESLNHKDSFPIRELSFGFCSRNREESLFPITPTYPICYPELNHTQNGNITAIVNALEHWYYERCTKKLQQKFGCRNVRMSPSCRILLVMLLTEQSNPCLMVWGLASDPVSRIITGLFMYPDTFALLAVFHKTAPVYWVGG